ncbi:MAG TPA: RNase adapter RapZ, partial [Myxococcaceae bacterium]|nr:RNase adapter RapZ [Myxococcaceae bacterium]
MDAPANERRRIVILTGVSGSGKSTAVRALEDAGYFCIDNLPVVLLPQLTGLAELAQPDTRLALVVDAREGDMLRQAPGILARLRAEGHHVELVFLDASDESLVRRYSETRRRHPLATEESVPAGIARERELLGDLRDLADQVIDTSELNVHDLKRLVMARFGESGTSVPSLTVISFGYRYGVPPQADLVFDLRFLPNPYFVPELKPLTGEDPRVARYVLERSEAQEFLDRIVDLAQ